MAYSTQRTTSDGTLATLGVTIKYLRQQDITVLFDDLPAAPGTWAWVGTTPVIAFTPVVPNGVVVTLKRTTQQDKVINVFSLGAAFKNSTVDSNFAQSLYIAQEAMEGAGLSGAFQNVDFHGYKPTNVGVAVDDTDLLQYGQYKADINSTYANKVAAENAAADAAQSAADAAASAASINPAQLINKDSNTGAANMPAGTTAERGPVTLGRFRYNTTTAKWEGANGASWANVGDPTFDGVFFQNNQAITQSRVIPAGKNEFSCGPITIPDGLSVTVSDGAVWTVI